MMSELQPILIAAAVFIPAVALAQFFDTRSIRRKLQAMLESLYRGNLHAPEDFHFLDTQPNQLYFPFTEAELRCIARAQEVNRHELTVEITHPGQVFWNNYYFHVRCTFEGLDQQYAPFTLKKEGYLYIACSRHRGYFRPCITHIERRSQPFTV